MDIDLLRATYVECYLDCRYGLQGKRQEIVERDILDIPVESTYLDVACGRGETIALGQARGLSTFGTEIVPYLCDASPYILNVALPHLPYKDKQFQYVSCYDVVEHLPIGIVEPSLCELFRVADRQVIITTNNHSSLHHGVELHITRMPRWWWHKRIQSLSDARGWRCETSVFGRRDDDWHWKCRAP